MENKNERKNYKKFHLPSESNAKKSLKRAIGQVAVIAVVVVIIIVIVGGAYAVIYLPSHSTTTTTSPTTSSTSPMSTTSTGSSPGLTVEIASSASTGNYLANGSGFTLYMFAKDAPGNGTSACTGACAGAWPPFYTGSSMNLQTGLNSSSFSTITRSDGSKQTTYNGWPLYRLSADASSGSMLGEGANQYGGLWYAIPPTMQQSGGLVIGGPSFSVGLAYKPSLGLYLTNSSGFALYYHSTDTPNSGNTTCTSSGCEANWPVFYSSSLKLPPGLSSTQFSTITPYNSTKIVTYNGYPLFYWAHDAKPGDATGQGIGSFYVAPVPFASATTTTTTTAASSTSTTQTTSHCSYYCG